MTSEQRFDQLLKASLDWQASRAAARQPSLRQATETLAARIAPPATILRPRITLTPATAGGLNLIAIILLLLALVAASVFIGSLLTRMEPPILPPGPFGYSAECRVGLRDGVAFELGIEFPAGPGPANAQDLNITLWRDGTLVKNNWTSRGTMVATIRQEQFPQRRLTEAGVDLLLDRISQSGLTPGCRSLRTERAGGRISALTNAGYVEVFWGPNVTNRPLARLLTAEEEAELTALAADLRDPQTWLPQDAWIESSVHIARPDQWLVSVGIKPTNHVPGDVVVLLTGETVAGSDPRYEEVVLPGDADLATFGEVALALPPGNEQGYETQRCGVLSTDDALAFARSIDSLALGTDRDPDSFFTPDLRLELSVGIQAAYPTSYDCNALAATLARLSAPLPEASEPVGELAHVDPCTLVPASAEGILETDSRATHPSRMPFGVAARACVLFDSGRVDEFGDPYYGLVMVSLYPRHIARERAEEIAVGILGAETASQTIAGQPVWANNCMTASLGCDAAVVAWVESRLIAIELTEAWFRPVGPSTIGDYGGPRLTDDMKSQIIEAVIDYLAP